MKPSFLIIPFLIAFSFSCIDKDVQKVNIKNDYQPSLAVPIGSSSFVLKEFLPQLSSLINTPINEYESGLIYILFEQPLYSLNVGDFLTVPDMSLPAFPELTFQNFPFVFDTISRNFELNYDFGPPNNDDIYIDSILLNSGNIHFNINLSGLEPCQLIITFPKITRNGIPLVFESNSGDSLQTNPDMPIGEGYKIDYTNPGHHNSFPMNVRLILSRNGRTNANGSFQLSGSINSLEFSGIYGFFGRYSRQTDPISVNLNFFEAVPPNSQFIENPTVKLIIDNGLGFPMDFYFNNFEFFSQQSGNVILTGTGVPSSETHTQTIRYPGLDQPGDTLRTEFVLNKDNSTIADAFHASPTSVSITTTFMVNKDGYNSSNYAENIDQLDLGIEIELPISAKVKYFPLADTIQFSLSQLADNINKIKSLLFKLESKNGFPTDAKLQVYFSDGNNLIDSLLTDSTGQLLVSGVVDADGKVIKPSTQNLDILLPAEKLQLITETTRLIIKCDINTTSKGNQWVKFYSDYSIKVSIGVKADFNLKLNELGF